MIDWKENEKKTLDNIKTYPIFPTSIYCSYSDPSEALSCVDQLEYEMIESNDGYISIDKHILNQSFMVNVKNIIQDNINYYTREILKIKPEIEFYITTSWVMKHVKDNSAGKHWHHNSLFSGVYYLQCDKDSGKIKFYSEDNSFSTKTINLDITEYNAYNSTEFSILPAAGNIIIFPSKLQHSVEPSNSNIDRYCIAFNTFAKGILGKNISSGLTELTLT